VQDSCFRKKLRQNCTHDSIQS